MNFLCLEILPTKIIFIKSTPAGKISNHDDGYLTGLGNMSLFLIFISVIKVTPILMQNQLFW